MDKDDLLVDKDDLLDELVECLKDRADVASAGRVDGEDVIGLEMQDGTEFFLALQPA